MGDVASDSSFWVLADLPPNSAAHPGAWVHGGFEDCPSREVPGGRFSSGERPLPRRRQRLPPRSLFPSISLSLYLSLAHQANVGIVDVNIVVLMQGK